MTDEHDIRSLIRRWAKAVHAGDIAAVVADHDDDILMFDVPPPHRGVRGLAAYTAVWPDFFRWQASGAVFDIDSLDITAGTDVAFVTALVRCGHPDELDAYPDRRLRLTVGLRKMRDRWVVTHEHHSYAYTAEPES